MSVARGGFKGAGGPHLKSLVPFGPTTARSKVNDAGILLAMCIRERRFMSIVFNFTLVLLVSL